MYVRVLNVSVARNVRYIGLPRVVVRYLVARAWTCPTPLVVLDDGEWAAQQKRRY